jgi:hypothetical protein
MSFAIWSLVIGALLITIALAGTTLRRFQQDASQPCTTSQVGNAMNYVRYRTE